uniref:Reverse transcriptase domain-containing protein n=1 Tax=Haemonchus contortus TaxID=6289 RepID=A0A7I4YNC5_HAECO
MGQRLAPVLAIAYMSRIEKPLLDRRPIVHCRYIDDCFVVCSTEEEMDTCYELLNRQAENIKFTREKPRDNWLPFLNTQVRLEGGFYRTKWYRKPSSKNILVHFNSAHPFRTKRTIKSNMFKTAILVSSGRQEKADSLELARKIALSNGYPLAPKNSYGAHKKEHHGLTTGNSDKVAFCIPYISDAISSEIRAALHKCGLKDMVRVVEIAPENLKQRLVRNRCYDRICLTPNCVVCPNGQEGDCMTSGVVYLITCNLCEDEYIGETGRPLCVRVKEHLEGLNRARVETPLGAHRVESHKGVVFGITVRILLREPLTSARKTLEAFFINANSPKMNRKEECLAVANELAPFSDLCGFCLPPVSRREG